MTIIRLFCCLCLLSVLAGPVFAANQNDNQQAIVQLQHENTALQRKVRRLEAQVAAMREDLNTPGLNQIAGGIGYVVGIFGVAAWIAARKKEGQAS